MTCTKHWPFLHVSPIFLRIFCDLHLSSSLFCLQYFSFKCNFVESVYSIFSSLSSTFRIFVCYVFVPGILKELGYIILHEINIWRLFLGLEVYISRIFVASSNHFLIFHRFKFTWLMLTCKRLFYVDIFLNFCVAMQTIFYYKYMHAYFQIFGNPTRPLTERDLTHPPFSHPLSPHPPSLTPSALTPLLSPPQPSPPFLSPSSPHRSLRPQHSLLQNPHASSLPLALNPS